MTSCTIASSDSPDCGDEWSRTVESASISSMWGSWCRTHSTTRSSGDLTTTLRHIDVDEDDKRAAIAEVFGSVAAKWQQESKSE